MHVVNADASIEDYTYTADGFDFDVYIRASTYDGLNRVVDQTTQQLTGSAYTTTTLHNDYRADVGGENYSGADAGVLVHSRQVSGSSTIDTLYSYNWWDVAKQASILVRGDNGSSTYHYATGESQMFYDVNGHITSAILNGNGATTITYLNDAYGQVMQRDVHDASDNISRQTYYYYFDGHRIGDVSNDGPSRVDYAAAAAQNARQTNSAQYRSVQPVFAADFDQNYEPISPDYPGGASSYYTSVAGDTLQSIAQTSWGDSSLWYLIADANGLKLSDTLVAGQRIAIPNKVTNFHNRSGVYRVYDPGEAIGDLMPTLPPEPAIVAAPASKGKHCGVIGQILVAAVAIAVMAVLPETAGILASTLEGATAGLVSQGFAVATGIQDKFSFKAVAMGALSAGVGGGQLNLGSGLAANVARSVIGNVVTQGIATATGLQSKFDWTGGAAAGVVGGVSGAVGGSLHTADTAFGNAANRFVSGMAGGIAGAAARSLIDGSDFGDNIMRTLPDVIANTAGHLVADGIAAIGSGRAGTTLTGAGDATRAQPQADQNAPDSDGFQLNRAAFDSLRGVNNDDFNRRFPVPYIDASGQVGYSTTLSDAGISSAYYAALTGSVTGRIYAAAPTLIADGARTGELSSQYTQWPRLHF